MKHGDVVLVFTYAAGGVIDAVESTAVTGDGIVKAVCILEDNCANKLHRRRRVS